MASFLTMLVPKTFGACTMRKLFGVLSLIVLLGLPSFVRADAITVGGTGLTATAGAANITTSGDQASITSYIGSYLIKPVFGLVGVAFFVLMVYGGVLWMTAHGNPKQVEKAQGVLTTAVIGAVIIVSAYVLTNALFNALLTGNATGV